MEYKQKTTAILSTIMSTCMSRFTENNFITNTEMHYQLNKDQ